MTKNIISEWEPIKPIRKNKSMPNEVYWAHKNMISTSPPDLCRKELFEIHSSSAYEKEGHKTIAEFLKSIHGLYARAYLDSLLAANAEATVFDENSIGNIDVAAAIAMRKIMNCRTSINRVKRYMDENNLTWSYENTQVAINTTCNLSKIIQEKKKRASRKKSLSDKEKATIYINGLSSKEKIVFIEELVEDIGLKDIVNKLNAIFEAKSRIVQTINCCERMLSENAQYILDPSMLDNAIYYMNTELLNEFGDRND